MSFDQIAYLREYRKKNRAEIAQKRSAKYLARREEMLQAGRERYEARQEKAIKYARWQRLVFGKEINQKRREVYLRNKRMVFAAYGDACSCCGETNPGFLTIDHINNDGHLDPDRCGGVFYRRIVRGGFPKDKYRLMCMNCNWGRRKTKICPHEAERTDLRLLAQNQ